MTSKVKLTKETIGVLTNFVDINQSIVFRKGNTIKTISNAENILAEYTCEEDFPIDFAIYDLVQFLNGISLYGDPELDFQNESYLTIRDGKNHRTKYFFADPSCIVLPPEKSLTLPSTDASFTLDTNNLTQLLKAAAIYQLPDLSAVGDNGVVQLVVRDKKNDTSNDFSIVVGETDKKFTFNFKVENIKILPGTYQVAISCLLYTSPSPRD